ncbi:MAG: flagellar cap protein [Alteromonadaceae bacterium]|nr:MAG: flagellar cap protein [Alteromonadaceae bacterium]
MIDNNIIQSLGIGSGINTNNIVSQLVEIEKIGPQTRIDDKKELTESQISDYGLLKSALATLQDAAEAVTNPEGMFSKAASFSDSTALVPTDLDPDVLPGSYDFTVSNIAKAQSLSSTGFTAANDAVGLGDLTFRFGDYDAGVTTFTEDPESTSKTITIDSSNNTLSGLRDAINDADMGVQASIVNDGTSFRLLISAESGENNQIEITAAEAGGTPTDTDNAGLSRFAFSGTVKQMTQNQAGENAEITVNGLAITRSSNKIDDVVDGLSLDITKKTEVGEVVNVTVTDDKDFAEQTIRDFVTAYNDFLGEIETAIGFDEENDEKGSLANDSLAKSIISQLRTNISSTIPGLTEGAFTTIASIGIRTELDGTLSIDDEDFSAAIESNFEDIQQLFAPHNSSSASDISVNSFGDQTIAGSYDVTITTTPRKTVFTSDTVPSFDTTGKIDFFNITVNGIESGTLNLPAADYGSGSAMAAALQTLINSDETLAANNASLVVTFDTDHFNFTTNKYGAGSGISFSGLSADAEADLGLLAGSISQSGRDVSGVVNGQVAFGLGEVLLPPLGSDAEGLTLIVGENATGGTIDFSRGFAGEMDALVNEFLSSTGLIANKEATLVQRLSGFTTEQESLDRRIGAFEGRLIQQFIAMENILNGLNSSGSFLENLINTLPFTASKN